MRARVITLQYSLFFKDIVERPDLEFGSINTHMLNLFDAIPYILPIPKELPNEIPIISLRSQSSGYLCNISRSRIDLILERTSDDKSNTELIKDFNSKVIAFSKFILNKQDVIRFGMISRYFFIEKKPIESIKKKYFSKSIQDVQELSVRFNKKSKFNDFEINDVIEISSSVMKLKDEISDGIFIQRDINNVPNIDKRIEISELESISSNYSSNILEENMERLIK